MNFDDLFKPYSPELRGDLLEYLKGQQEGSAENHFYGPEHFFAIRDLGIIIPNLTRVRVDRSPAPDWLYFVNSGSLLESGGHRGEPNMSLIAAEAGVYEPNVVLSEMHWSISNLRIFE